MDIIKKNRGFTLLFIPIALVTANSLLLGITIKPFLVLVGTFLFVISFVNTNLALIIVLFSMFFSPEFELGAIPGRAVFVRFDDMFLFVIFFGWLAKMAVNKELTLFRATPINKPIALYIGMCLLSSLIGIVLGTTSLKTSIFYNAKYIEYFLLFFLVSNNIKDRKQVKVFLFFMLLVCVLVSIYGLGLHFSTGRRATAPFEGEIGEPNTLAGYLIIMMGIALGLCLHGKSLRYRVLFGGLLIFFTLPFLYSLSRTAWIAFFAMYAAFLIFSKKYKIWLLIILILAVWKLPSKLPGEVINRYDETFNPSYVGRVFNVFGKEIAIDESASERIRSWGESLKLWYEYPIFGIGVPGWGVVSDVQWTRTLREVGIVGFCAFMWLVIRLLKTAWKSYTYSQEDYFCQGLSLGFICSFIGILVMGIGAEVFLIIRVMEPFWFLAAMVVILPEVSITPEVTASE